MQLEIAVLSKPGGRERNEDACGTWSAPTTTFCVLSDGVGGHDGGEFASRLTVRYMLEWFRQRPEGTPEALNSAVNETNRELCDTQARVPKLRDMRATIVVLAIDTLAGVGCWGHVGDSRLYWFNDDRIVAQTRDDSVVQHMVDEGLLRFEEARASPLRNQLMTALGDMRGVDAHVLTNPIEVEVGDAFLLCSDGLWEYLEDSELEQALSEASSPADWLSALEKHVIARGRERQDNYSAIAVWCHPTPDDHEEET